MKRIGIIGMGKWGKNLIKEFSNFVEIPICVTNGNKENIKWTQKFFPKTKTSTNINDVLNDNSIDAIVIATPITTHYELIKKSLKAGKHVFVEKPMVQTVTHANDIIDIAKQKKLCLFVGHIFLHNQIFKQIKKINKSEPIIELNFDWRKFGTFEENIFENLLSHELSINLELFGIPNKFELLSKSSCITDIDSIYVKLDYGKNRTSDIHINRISNYKKKVITIITKKNLFIWDENKLFKLNKKTKSFKVYFESSKTPLFLECKNFVSDISTKKSKIDSAILARDITSIVSKIKKQ
ncbi:Gfo/Idh/MocA family oxidoreductase [Nitrosopumilus sp.]|nr:Gfo/Idh/MocA family oxidoreductase [Nitrosopumilus sp.]